MGARRGKPWGSKRLQKILCEMGAKQGKFPKAFLVYLDTHFLSLIMLEYFLGRSLCAGRAQTLCRPCTNLVQAMHKTCTNQVRAISFNSRERGDQKVQNVEEKMRRDKRERNIGNASRVFSREVTLCMLAQVFTCHSNSGSLSYEIPPKSPSSFEEVE